ncbi:hypothetical protein CDL15_Pgr001544 [Punica granatum]|uniref:Histone H2A C-terminal domain-containing protein n=1 Tax=Punica granatum TaxID=22663 RepID=A0A218X5X8_PUNGR|nr:hypothetical protein CDL15_Pgr001544 [Punica granatum]
MPMLIQLAMRNDKELSRLLWEVRIAKGSVVPNIHNMLLPNKAFRRAATPTTLIEPFLDRFLPILLFVQFSCLTV